MSTPSVAEDKDALLLRGGQRAWAVLGVVGVLVLAYLLLREVSILATPLVVAMFPAAVLSPAASWLKRRGVPGAVVALLLLRLFAVVGLALWFVVPQFAGQLPTLAESGQEAFGDLERFLADAPVPLRFDSGEGGLAAAAQQAADTSDGGAGELMGQGLDILQRVVDLGSALPISLVPLFSHLRDGDRIWAGVTRVLPGTTRRHVRRVSGQSWWTPGAHFRAQVLVALVDARHSCRWSARVTTGWSRGRSSRHSVPETDRASSARPVSGTIGPGRDRWLGEQVRQRVSRIGHHVGR